MKAAGFLVVCSTLLLSAPGFAEKGGGKGDKAARSERRGPRVKRQAGGPAAGAARRLELSPEADVQLTRLVLLVTRPKGNTHAHMFVEDAASRYRPGSRTAESMTYGIRGKYRVFKAPANDGSFVLMFGDKSGVYIHPDADTTFMGEDISGEVGDWEEIIRK
jgi:hypothetical protein